MERKKEDGVRREESCSTRSEETKDRKESEREKTVVQSS